MVKTLKELNARVDRLHEHFQKNFEEMKRSLSVTENEDHNEGISSGNKKEECKVKLMQMEVDFVSEINQIKDIIKQIGEKVTVLHNRQRNSELAVNRKTILIHGLSESLNNSLYKSVVEFFMNSLGKDVKMCDIEVIYRLGNKKEADKKPRPLIVKFCCQWLRDEIYYSKKALKGTSIFMTEKLTEENLKLLKEVRKVIGEYCWTKGGIVYIFYAGKKIAVRDNEDFNKLRLKLDKTELPANEISNTDSQ